MLDTATDRHAQGISHNWKAGWKTEVFCLLENNFQANSMIPCEVVLSEKKRRQINVRQSTTEGGWFHPKKVPGVDFTGSQSAWARGTLPGTGPRMGAWGANRNGQGEVGAADMKGRTTIMAVSASWVSRAEANVSSPPSDRIQNAWRSSPYLLLLSFFLGQYNLQ